MDLEVESGVMAGALPETENEYYEKWPTVQCQPIRDGQASCGEVYGAFPQDVNGPCPHCAEQAKDGTVRGYRGILTELTPEQAAEALRRRRSMAVGE